jgi:hypothetical protein
MEYCTYDVKTYLQDVVLQLQTQVKAKTEPVQATKAWG